MRYVCAVFGLTFPVRYIYLLCCFFSIFYVQYPCLVFGCGTLPVGLMLALCCLFSTFSAISFSGIRLLKFACEMQDEVVFFPLDLHRLRMGRLSGMHCVFQVYLQVNAIPANLLHNRLGSHASQRAESVNLAVLYLTRLS